MKNLVRAAREQAAQRIQAAYEKAANRGLLPAGWDISGGVETPRDGANGDFASSFAVAGAKALGVPPRQTAQVILEHLELDNTLFERAELAGPGYLNFFCASRWYKEVLDAVEQSLPVSALHHRPLPALPAPLTEVRRQVCGDVLDNLCQRAEMEPPAAPADVGPVVLLREGRPTPDGDWTQVGEDALRFFLTLRPIDKPVELDIDLSARQDGGNPLYYVQYTHARLCSLIANLKEQGACVPLCKDVDPALLCTGKEKALVKALALYPEELDLAAKRLDPSRVSRYLTALAGDCRCFYQACRLDSGDAALGAARRKLVDCARLVLANGLGLLGVGAPCGAVLSLM